MAEFRVPLTDKWPADGGSPFIPSPEILMKKIFPKGATNHHSILRPRVYEYPEDLEDQFNSCPFDISSAYPLPNPKQYYVAAKELEEFQESKIHLDLRGMTTKWFTENSSEADEIYFAIEIWNKALETFKIILSDSVGATGSRAGEELRNKYAISRLKKYQLNPIK